MVLSYKHKGLKRLAEEGVAKGIIPAQAKRIIARLDRLDAIESLDDLPSGWRCHALQGNMEGYFAIDVSAQWRLVFHFENGNTLDVDYVQYH